MPAKTSLGEKTDYPDHYARDVLYPVARAENRQKLGLSGALPFRGEDVWNAYEITWLERAGKPVVAVGTIRVDAQSPRIVESKSLKLYLNSLAMERFDSADDVAALVARDLSGLTDSPVQVALTPPNAAAGIGIRNLPGTCIDDVAVACDSWQVDPSLIECDSGKIVREDLHTHLLRSLCPVTGQPDFGSVLLRYCGPALDRTALLRYLVSYRMHNDFHENCIERIFVDVKHRCMPSELTVYGRFNRRGGIDINPFRSDFEATIDNPRLWRQ
ncbi:MAG: NADPH-dependent 7-cyano-7-deazaguanine reductase QueF [Woeseia sp.]